MPHVIDKNNNHIFDEDGNKIEYHIEYFDTDDWYKHKEPLHINDDGHIDCEDRNIVVKEGIQPDHAVCKKQLDQLDTNTKELIDNKLSALQNLINSSITAMFKAHEAKILTQMLNFRNQQIKDRIQRKYIRIPRTPNVWIKLFDHKDIGDGSLDLKSIIILNVWIQRWDRFHNAKSALLEKDFHNSIEFFYSSDMKGYYTYFTHTPSDWNMRCFIEWLRIPKFIPIDNENKEAKPILIDNENISEAKPESNFAGNNV